MAKDTRVEVIATRLRGDMTFLVRYVQNLLSKATQENSGDVHADVCDRVAQVFDLYDDTNCFPTWLSRVVEGVIRDLAEGEHAV